MLIQFELVFGPSGQSNMQSKLDFCPRPAMREKNVPLDKRSKQLTVLIYIYCALRLVLKMTRLETNLRDRWAPDKPGLPQLILNEGSNL